MWINPASPNNFTGFVAGNNYVSFTNLTGSGQIMNVARVANNVGMAAFQIVNHPIPVYTITASAGVGGTISPAGAIPVISGTNQSFTISANGGHAISNVTVDAVSQGAISSYTFTNVLTNNTITAAFVVLPPPVISASSMTITNGTASFDVSNTLSGHQYTLVFKTNLTDANWTPLPSLGSVAGNGGTTNLSDTNVISSQAQRFFRTQLQ